MRKLGRRLQYLLERGRRASELEEEMRLHVEMRAERLRERGMPAVDARFTALRRFGNRAAIEIASDQAWGWTMLERLAQDIRQAVRGLRKTPAFTLMAVLTLGVGLGMNTAVFSIVNAVMLRSLPYTAPDRLVSLWEVPPLHDVHNRSSSGSNLGGAGGKQRSTVAPANLMDYRAGANAFEGLAGVDRTAVNLTGEGAPERVVSEAVTANYFPVLGAKPAQGRTFTEAEDRPGATHVVVIAHDFWQRRLGGDTAVLSRSVMLDGKPYAVIGVMPRGFQSATQFSGPERVELWTPAAYPADLLASHGDHEIGVIGRLRTGYSLAAAQQQLNGVSKGLGEKFPDSNLGMTAAIAPLREDIVHGVRDSLSALWGASALIVLITCVNVANLLLVRAAGRRHETSVRMALGAGRGRVARQFLVESLLVATAGGAVGIGLGRALMRLLVASAPPNTPRLDGVSLDWSVFLAAAAVATFTGLVFGLAPAWQASRTSPGESLKATERRGGSRGLARWRAVLTVAEVALSIVLVVGAGLFLKSFMTTMGIDLGFRTDRVLAMSINLPEMRYRTQADRFRFFHELEQRVQALPGVEASAFANRFPLRGGWSTGIEIEGVGESSQSPDSQAVSTRYFETLGISLVRGRLLTEGDRLGQVHVSVVNREFARLFLNGADPIGRRFRRGSGQPWFTVVGVVNDVRRGGKTKVMNPQVYLPAAQTDAYPVRLADFAVRTANDPRLHRHAIEQQVWALDKDQPVTAVRTMEELIDRSVSEQRFQMLLLGVFAGVAVVLAMIGVFSVLMYSVNQRMNELGVRMALGASPGRILAMVMKQAGALIASGIVLGVAGALALTRLVENLLFQVKANDAATYAAAVGLLALVSLCAAAIPARRGSRVDPVVALRWE